jgi:cell division protein FtsZ
VMGEPGKAMMGTAVASGADRARLAAEQAVVCPLLDGVDLSGAKGVLVNITADDSLKLSETREAMNAIRAYAAADAHIIFGTVNDPSMGDSLRVTVLATGLSRAKVAVKAAPSLTVLRTGTDAGPLSMGHGVGIDSTQIPAIWRNPRGNAPSAHVNALMQSGMDEMEIPAFLRKQAD